MSERRGFSGMQMFFVFLGGATAGAIVALLSAPKTGREMREQIRSVAQSGSEKARRLPEAVKSATGSARAAFSHSMREEEEEEAGRGFERPPLEEELAARSAIER